MSKGASMRVTEIDLPAGVAQRARIRDLLGEPRSVDIGHYHPRALLHLHGEGRAITVEDPGGYRCVQLGLPGHPGQGWTGQQCLVPLRGVE
jgi:hypothetical protein